MGSLSLWIFGKVRGADAPRWVWRSVVDLDLVEQRLRDLLRVGLLDDDRVLGARGSEEGLLRRRTAEGGDEDRVRHRRLLRRRLRHPAERLGELADRYLIAPHDPKSSVTLVTRSLLVVSGAFFVLQTIKVSSSTKSKEPKSSESISWIS